jgi:hypothetical protein
MLSPEPQVMRSDAAHAAAGTAAGIFQFQGKRSAIRLAEWAGSCASTLASQARGSMSSRLAVSINV